MIIPCVRITIFGGEKTLIFQISIVKQTIHSKNESDLAGS